MTHAIHRLTNVTTIYSTVCIASVRYPSAVASFVVFVMCTAASVSSKFVGIFKFKKCLVSDALRTVAQTDSNGSIGKRASDSTCMCGFILPPVAGSLSICHRTYVPLVQESRHTAPAKIKNK